MEPSASSWTDDLSISRERSWEYTREQCGGKVRWSFSERKTVSVDGEVVALRERAAGQDRDLDSRGERRDCSGSR